MVIHGGWIDRHGSVDIRRNEANFSTYFHRSYIHSLRYSVLRRAGSERKSNFQIFFNGTRATSACREQVGPIVLSASNWSILFLPFSCFFFSYSLFHSFFPGLLFYSRSSARSIVAVGQTAPSIGISRSFRIGELIDFFQPPTYFAARIRKVLLPTAT